MQYSLKFPANSGYSSQDYVVTKANNIAHRVIMLEDRPWGVAPYPHHLLLIGNKSSGKTHLAQLWSQKHHAECGNNAINHGCVIDNIELRKEQDLLHLFNRMHEDKQPLLMTASAMPAFKLQDLQSRINSVRTVHLMIPDEEMVMVLLMRNFSARSLKVSNEVVEYLSTRLKRDFDAIKIFIEHLDKYALDFGRNITIPLIRKLLNNVGE